MKKLPICSAIILATTSILAQSRWPMADARVIYSQRGVPIASMLNKSDRFVVVQRGNVISEYVDNRVLSLNEDLDARVQSAHAIAVVELEKSDSFLAEQGAWINSKLTLRLIQLIKESQQPLFDRNGFVTVNHAGGELRFGDVRVRAGRYYELFPRNRYLVFLRAPRDGYVAFVGMQLKVSESGRMAPIDLSDGNVAIAASPLYDLPVVDVIAELKRR